VEVSGQLNSPVAQSPGIEPSEPMEKEVGRDPLPVRTFGEEKKPHAPVGNRTQEWPAGSLVAMHVLSRLSRLSLER
jgi:hypothetical protein